MRRGSGATLDEPIVDVVEGEDVVSAEPWSARARGLARHARRARQSAEVVEEALQEPTPRRRWRGRRSKDAVESLAEAAVAAIEPPKRSRRWPKLLLLVAGLAAAILGLRKARAAGALGSGSAAAASGPIEETVEVDVPVRTAYDQWTQFEEFPSFMGGVEEVRQLDDTNLHWVAKVGGRRREWDARIVEQVPDQRIAWTSTGGVRNGGVVTFAPLDEGRTRVSVSMDFEPDAPIEAIGHRLGLDRRRVRADLERFRELIESRGQETGAWRGTVTDGQPSG
jgi:uncharacterized membrane protein